LKKSRISQKAYKIYKTLKVLDRLYGVYQKISGNFETALNFTNSFMYIPLNAGIPLYEN
jgi:hypothetical protein